MGQEILKVIYLRYRLTANKIIEEKSKINMSKTMHFPTWDKKRTFQTFKQTFMGYFWQTTRN